MTGPLVLCGAVALTAACTRLTGGTALPAFGGPGRGIDIDEILLDQSRMRAITGVGGQLAWMPSMDHDAPADIDAFAKNTPQACRFVFAETATFGPDTQRFRSMTFEDTPEGALISEAAATYHDSALAQRAFQTLVTDVGHCANGPAGRLYVGGWNADASSLHLRLGNCVRDYRVSAVALLEVTSCGFTQAATDSVLAAIDANVRASRR